MMMRMKMRMMKVEWILIRSLNVLLCFALKFALFFPENNLC